MTAHHLGLGGTVNLGMTNCDCGGTVNVRADDLTILTLAVGIWGISNNTVSSCKDPSLTNNTRSAQVLLPILQG